MRLDVFVFFTVNLAFTALASVSPAIDFAKRRQGELFFSGSAILPRQAVGRFNLQTFTGALGGVPAPAITNSGDPERPFEVDGDTFPDFRSASERACDRQKNACADLANNGSANFKVGDCDQQNERCKSVAAAATVTSFPVFVGSSAEYDFFCDP